MLRDVATEAGDTVIKVPLWMPVLHVGVPGFESQFHSPPQLPADA